MNTDEKRHFINELMDGVKQHILSRAERMPEDWDGHELRRYIADTVADQVVFCEITRQRLREYRNEVITRNL